MDLVRGEMDAWGGPAGKGHLLHGVFPRSGLLEWVGDCIIKGLRTLEIDQWCGLAAFTFGILVIPD